MVTRDSALITESRTLHRSRDFMVIWSMVSNLKDFENEDQMHEIRFTI